MIKLPPYLYRGDADPKGERNLKMWRHGSLLTNLSSGGSVREIFCAPLVDLVRRHVDIGWEKTHFLSFSESRSRAKVFAGEREGRDLILVDTSEWDAALITLDTGFFANLQTYGVGIYQCSYPSIPLSHNRNTLPELLSYGIPRQMAYFHRQGRPITVLLIDVVSHLRKQILDGQRELEVALEKAIRDSEWLILPLDPMEGNPGEQTAALDISCVSTFECYRFEPSS